MADNVRLVPAATRHVATIANRMRAIDIAECAAMGHTPKQALREAVLSSDVAWTAMVGDRPEAMFGVVVNSALTGEGAPWFLGTDVVWQHPRALLTMGPAILARIGDSSPNLSGLVSAVNDPAIRLLRKWSFSVAKHGPEIGGVTFLPFELRR